MFRRDTRAKFLKNGFWFLTSYSFHAGRLSSASRWSRLEFGQLVERQQSVPVELMRDGSSRRTWWMYEGEFYWEDEGYGVGEVKALVFERTRKKDRRLEKAMSLMAQGDAETSTSRELISDDVKVFVWNRDGGKCVKCGSQENLEFDHIIPFARGGSSTARNLQLLCETCNRSKSDSLI